MMTAKAVEQDVRQAPRHSDVIELQQVDTTGSAPSNDDGAVSDGAITREQRRSRRKRDVRARTISVKRMTKRELEIGRLLYPETDYWRPKTRSECVDGPRPCPFVSCKHHLFIDVSPRTGAIKLNFPDLEVWELTESCALDVADRGGTTLEDVGAIMNLTRERIRQVEVKALAKLEALQDMETLRDYVDEGPVGKRRLPQITEADLNPKLRGRTKVSSAPSSVDVSDISDIEDQDDGDEVEIDRTVDIDLLDI